MFKHVQKKEQQTRFIFNEKFLENKPIPFPDFTKRYNYSNLFYWAHLQALETAAFPLHPHEGFEIMTFVLNGNIEHFDTATNVWTPIEEGGFQVIQSGSGLQHSEKIIKDSHVFQIWFDPDFSKTLKKEPTYKDYKNDFIKPKIIDGRKIYEYIGDSDVFHQTKDIRVTKEYFTNENYSIKLDLNYIYSIYVISGDAEINDKVSTKDDFIIVQDIKNLDINVLNDLELFIIQTPKIINYQTV